MTSKNDRFFDPKDGTYANVPIIRVNSELFQGKRPFGTNVLIGNWYEDRSKIKESSHRSKPFYRITYPVDVGSAPDLVLRRKVLSSKEERPGRLILDHHDIDQQKQFISSYDEQYNRRGAYGDHQDTSERTWALQDNHWLPERNDHPLESTPTSWGLIEKKRTQTQFLQRQRTMPNLSEYTNRYIRHRPEEYSSSKLIGIPRIYSTGVARTNSLNNNIYNPRPLTTPNAIDIDHICSFRRNTNVPRAYFYLGAVPNQTDNKMQNHLSFSTKSTNTIQPVTLSMQETV